MRKRIGKEDGEIMALCKLSAEAELCYGVECPHYKRCWKHLNPNEEGFFQAEVKKVVKVG